MREAAARAQCQNNLKQIALGLHNYLDQHRHFPSATVEAKGLTPDKRLSWLAAILPFVDQNTLATQLEWKSAWDAERNRQPASSGIPGFWCPAGPGSVDTTPNQTHYVGLAGLGVDAPLLEKDDRSAGFFGYTRRISMADITDGSSNTIAVMETGTANGPWAAGGRPTLRSLDPDETTYIAEDGPFGMKHKTDTFFRTNPVTANATLADASVRGISADIAAEILRALATIAGREEARTDY